MGVPIDIVQQVTDSNGDILQAFSDYIADIYACTKTDIFKMFEQLDIQSLTQLREGLFEKLCDQRPSLFGHELIKRKKQNTLIDDIYVIGYSLVNGLEDRKIKKVLKADNENCNDSLNESNTLISDPSNRALITICAELKAAVRKLENNIKTLGARITEVEDENSECLKCLILTRQMILWQESPKINLDRGPRVLLVVLKADPVDPVQN